LIEGAATRPNHLIATELTKSPHCDGIWRKPRVAALQSKNQKLVAQTLKNDQQKSPKTISFIRVAALQSHKKQLKNGVECRI